MTRDPVSELSDTRIVTIGCVLGYHASRSVPGLFLILPHAGPDYCILREELAVDTGAPVERYTDLYGNSGLKTVLVSGYNEFHYEATLELPLQSGLRASAHHDASPYDIPAEVFHYSLPSRYCESDKLYGFAQERFSHVPHGFAQAQAVCNWVHDHLEYRYGSGNPTLSACEAIYRGFGVCRDFAHVMIALCRALDLPARYVAGYVPIMPENEIEGDNDIGIDFHAYAEVYFDGRWHTFDARYNQPLSGRIKVAHGMDAVDAAFATFYGNVDVAKFEVWARQTGASPDVHMVPKCRAARMPRHAV